MGYAMQKRQRPTTDLTQHVPSAATCHQLKRAGFPQTTFVSWTKKVSANEQSWVLEDSTLAHLHYQLDTVVERPVPLGKGATRPPDEVVAAPILSEIWAQLAAEKIYALPALLENLGFQFAVGRIANIAEASALLYLRLKRPPPAELSA